MARRIVLLVGLLVALGVCGASAPAAVPAAAPPGAVNGIPDVYSGSWPAQLMPSREALGTITWVPISSEWGRNMLGSYWGGSPFTNCPPAGQTRFFIGRYDSGGQLLACTVGADGRTLHGRYDGAGGEFRPGSFDVTIVRESPRIFFGKYVEDGGITTDWCGQLLPETTPDFVAPSVTAYASSGRAGHAVPLRFSASDDRGEVRVRLTIARRGAAKTIGSVASSLRTFAARASLVWRAPRRLHGTFTFCVRAWDAYGNASARSCSTVRID
jgi:hypothetical protein